MTYRARCEGRRYRRRCTLHDSVLGLHEAPVSYWPRLTTMIYYCFTRWSSDDRAFLGLCLEFPNLSYLAPTQPEAFEGIMNLVTCVVREMQRSGEPLPEGR